MLTPLTNFRVHPVYMCIFLNILALFIGTANGLGDYIFGQATHQYVLSENNIILVFFIYLYVHLQHTQLWISFTGWLGHLFMSPAHHQIHHSRNPAHFNKISEAASRSGIGCSERCMCLPPSRRS